MQGDSEAFVGAKAACHVVVDVGVFIAAAVFLALSTRGTQLRTGLPRRPATRVTAPLKEIIIMFQLKINLRMSGGQGEVVSIFQSLLSALPAQVKKLIIISTIHLKIYC